MDESTKPKIIAGAAVVAAALGVGAYFWLSAEPEAPPAPPPPAAQTAEPPNYTVPATKPAGQAPLPTLAESDPVVLESLKSLFTGEALQQYLVPDDLVRHIVVTVDNLPRKKISERLKPVKPIEGSFKVGGTEEARELDPANAERYRALMQLISITDMDQVAALYFQFYPLFQEAYTDLGYPEGYFNNRLVEVIDHLLGTPNVEGPIKLVQPNVMYEYADPKIENLSAGQKVLIRVGKDNAAIIKNKLRELRAAVTKQASEAPTAP